MNSIKGQIARRFLEFAARNVPHSEVRVATLGGLGVEPRVWEEFGIPPEHGWLIERNRARGAALLRAHRYRTHNQLGSFAQVLASYGDTTGVDAFHLDLSGTLQGTVAAEFATILPLVLKSRARCLAVTVPDARRNKILESWPSYSRRARARLGKGWRQVLERLVAHQAALPAREDLPAFMILFDPQKAAKRELGLMLDLLDHFSAERTGPTEMVRYAYVSRYGNSPFRMRTYFFRLGAPGTFSSNNVSAGTWLSSPLYFGNDEGMALIPEAPAETFLSTTEGKSTSMSESRLAAVARALGGPELAEYERLMDAEKRLQSLTAMVNGASPSASPAAPPQAHRKKRYDDLSPKEKIEWVINALETKARSNGDWERSGWKKLLEHDFGYYDAALGLSLRAVMSRASGKFRSQFRERIKHVFGAKAKPYIDRLNALKA